MAYVKAVSGQRVFFMLANVQSGLAITSGATNISGNKSVDGAAQALVSGTFTETGNGQYFFQGWTSDFNGASIGLLFTASGAVPISFSISTIDGGSSGFIFGPSGGTAVLSGNLSGQLVGLFSGNLSGQVVDLNSGQSFLASGSVILPSGGTVKVFSGNLSGQQVSILSGQISGQPIFVLSGQLSGQFVSTLSGQVVLPSGGNVGVFSGNLSGQVVDLNSGQSFMASGSVILPSGGNVKVFSGNLSGQRVDLNSGQSFLASGSVVLSSGGNVLVMSGNLSGQIVTPASGLSFLASGVVSGSIPTNVLAFNYSGLGTSGIRSLVQAARKLTNKIDAASGLSGKLVVYQEDDATIAYAENIVSVNIQSGQGITSLSPN